MSIIPPTIPRNAWEKASLVLGSGFLIKPGKLQALKPLNSLGELDVVRTSIATFINEQGLVETAPSNVLRIDWTTGEPLALIEPLRINVVLHSRDLTTAEWVRVNMTPVRNAMGANGVANTATTLTATSSNAVIMQSLSLSSTQRVYSAMIRRVSGNGRIEMTMDGGITWTIVTSQIGSSFKVIGIPAQTISNPQVGFRIANSGDQIAVDYVQLENGSYWTSRIETTTTAITRSADTVFKTGISSLIGQSEGTLFWEGMLLGNAMIAEVNADSNKYIQMWTQESAGVPFLNLYVQNIASILIDARNIFALSYNGMLRIAVAYKPNDYAIYLNGTQIFANSSAGVPATSNLSLSGSNQTPDSFGKKVKRTQLYPIRFTNAQLAELTRI